MLHAAFRITVWSQSIFEFGPTSFRARAEVLYIDEERCTREDIRVLERAISKNQDVKVSKVHEGETVLKFNGTEAFNIANAQGNPQYCNP